MLPGVIWSVTLPPPYRPGITNKVIIRKGKIAMSGVTLGFPINIHIVCPGVGLSGFLDY